MRALKKFEEFLSSETVRKQNIDIERAKNLILESQEKYTFFNKVKEKLRIENLSPNYIVETAYDILIEIIRAKLLLKGHTTDSHEAEISYMRNLKFSEETVNFMNELRYFRNGIKYYGKRLNREYAKKVLVFLEKTYEKLMERIKYD